MLHCTITNEIYSNHLFNDAMTKIIYYHKFIKLYKVNQQLYFFKSILDVLQT